LSRPQVLFLDTGPVVALFNKGEEEIAAKTEKLLEEYNFCSRHIVIPNLVELFYMIKQRTKMTPVDVWKNFDHLGIIPLPVPEDLSQAILKMYFGIPLKNAFDFADFYLCCAALQFKYSLIVTIDREDLPLALSWAQKSGLFPQTNVAQIIPVK
jgi:hypothetical protein